MALETANVGLVGMMHERVIVRFGEFAFPLTRERALNLAAWILAVADAPLAFEHVQVTGNGVKAQLSAEFVELLGKVQQS